MRRTLAGLAAGLAVAILIIMLVEAIGNQISPLPAGYDMKSGSAATLPVATLIWPVVGWFIGALVGAWLAGRISRQSWPSWTVAGLVLAAELLNFSLITHPLWMMAAGIVAALLGGWLGERLSRGSRTAASD